MHRSIRRTGAAFAAVAALGAGVAALAQGGAKPDDEKPPVRAPEGDPDIPPILTRHDTNFQNWTYSVEVRLHGFKSQALYDSRLLSTQPIVLDAVAAVYPLLRGSSMHDVYEDHVVSEFRVRGERSRMLDGGDAPRRVEGYQGPTTLLVWERRDINTRLITLRLDVPITSYETEIDEARAFEVPWPEGPWPLEVAQNLEPQLFVDPGDPDVRALVRKWTKGKPRAAKPYYLAKYLARKVIEHYQPTGLGYVSSGRGATTLVSDTFLVSGFEVRGAGFAARERRGSPHDLANLLVAVYRAAGLPARLVVGFDQSKLAEQRLPEVRAWAEFYIHDPVADRGEWIPVDVLRQREFGSRPPAVERRWEYFGRNIDFDTMIPLAFHWHPPTSVTNSGPPSLWGWIPKPANPVADQELRFTAGGTPIRAGDPDPPVRRYGVRR